MEKWEKANPAFCDFDSNKPKFYALGMFVYPSGWGLHAGHPKNYFPLDAICRYKKMKGFEVLNPMGFDAFGLPAEQHARKTGENPKITVEKAATRFRTQFQRLGMFFDWTKEINTSDPEYYKITQWCFLRLYKTGYAKRVLQPVLWCEGLGTVLAKEETRMVNDNLVSDIGEFKVEKREEFQWVLDIKRDAQNLLDSLTNDKLMRWPKDIINQQKQWIGKLCFQKNKIIINNEEFFPFSFTDISKLKNPTLYLSAKSKLFTKLMKKAKEVCQEYISRSMQIRVNFFLINNFLIKYKDLEYKIKVYLVNRNYVLNNISELLIQNIDLKEQLNLFLLGGQEYDYLFPKLSDHAEKYTLTKIDHFIYRIRDWVFSRQRYWGEPIPIVFDEDGNTHPVKEGQLPILLPKISQYLPKKGCLTVLETIKDWMVVKENGMAFWREPFTMPQWAGSSWYHLAYLLREKDGYLDITSKKARERFEKWMPVDIYIGGREHAVLHLIYARFWHHVLHYNYGNSKLLKSLLSIKEPYYILVNHGMVLDKHGKKMSKSKGNVIDPLKIVNKYGADAYRLFLLFSVPIREQTKLVLHDIKVMFDWLARVWRLIENNNPKWNDNQIIQEKFQILVKKVSIAIEKLKLNLAISYLMTFVNQCHKYCEGQIALNLVDGFLKILHCFAPFMSQELYQLFVDKNCVAITNTKWPTHDEQLISKKLIKIAIQINGKFRCVLQLSEELDKQEIIKLAYENKIVKKYLANKKIKSDFYIKNRLLNIVVV